MTTDQDNKIEQVIWDRVFSYLDVTYGSVTLEGKLIPMSELIDHQAHEWLFEMLYTKFSAEFQKDLDAFLDNQGVGVYA